MKNDGSYGAASLIDMQDPAKVIAKQEAGLWDVVLAPGIVATLYVKDYEVLDCVLSAETRSAKANLPAPYNTDDTSTMKKVREWYEKGYIEKDVITRTDASGTFTAGKAASFMWDTAQYNATLSALTQSVEGAKLEVYVFNPIFSEGLKGISQGSYTAWNFICIPVTTSDVKTDRIMMFFDWMFSSVENHDLFEWGIEGKNYTAIGDDQYGYPEGLDLSTNYNFPGYELTWNPNFIRYPVGYPEDVLSVMKQANDPATYYDPLLSGFRFNSEPVKNEMANPDFLLAKTRTDNLAYGIFEDVDAELAAIDQEFSNNSLLQEDIKAIKEEVIKQAKVYLAERKALDAERGTKYPTVADVESQRK
jgi:putative aldouronate transport system substrate-binding protein